MSHPHLDDPTLHDALRAMVRRRVRPADVDDVVQSTLADAVAAPAPPSDREQLRRWVFGIARHKIVDAHRARRHEPLEDHEESAAVAAEQVPAASEASEAAALLRWAERELPSGAEARSTLGLMLREGDGERLEHLAADARLPAATVRQRVHRLRQHFRARWTLQVAVLLALALGGLALYLALGDRHEMAIQPLPTGAPSLTIGGPSPSTSSKSEAPPRRDDAPSPSSSIPSQTNAPTKTAPEPAPKKKSVAPPELQRAPQQDAAKTPRGKPVAPPAPKGEANDNVFDDAPQNAAPNETKGSKAQGVKKPSK